MFNESDGNEITGNLGLSVVQGNSVSNNSKDDKTPNGSVNWHALCDLCADDGIVLSHYGSKSAAGKGKSRYQDDDESVDSGFSSTAMSRENTPVSKSNSNDDSDDEVLYGDVIDSSDVKVEVGFPPLHRSSSPQTSFIKTVSPSNGAVLRQGFKNNHK